MSAATWVHKAFKIGGAKDIDMSGQKITGLAAGAAAGEALNFSQLSTVKITTGTYSGSGQVNRAIAHNLGAKPKLVIINTRSASKGDAQAWGVEDGKMKYLDPQNGGYAYYTTYTAMDATNFYVGNATNYELSQNDVSYTYMWVAFV